MDMRMPLIGSAALFIVLIGIIYFTKLSAKAYPRNLLHSIKEPCDIAKLFPKTADELQKRVEVALQEAQQGIDAIIAIPDNERTFANTAQALDRICSYSDLAILANATVMLKMTSPDEAMRKTAQDMCEAIKKFQIEQISNNQALYRAFKWYVEHKAMAEKLSAEETRYLDELMKEFKRSGLELPEDRQQEVRALKAELAKLELQYETNIDQDATTITVKKDDLEGLPEDFINQLKTTSEGDFVIGIDYSTHSRVMELCTVAETRKKMYRAIINRAYPINEALLQEIIKKRQKLAELLGFANYAALDIDDTMALSPQVVNQFLTDLVAKVAAKEKEELDQFAQNLHPSVQLTSLGQFNPWDILFAKDYFKRAHLQLDEQTIAEYFPMEKTIDGLIQVYGKFFNLKFNKVDACKLWHDEVQVLQVADAENNALLGYLILDLHPRPNKFSHACQETIVPPIIESGKTDAPFVCVIVANFPHSTPEKPSLLNRNEVRTFFHECGHALHALFGRSRIGFFSGLNVKFDFVEVPSQMFEEWLADPDVLRVVSSHYKTGEPLPDEIIEKIVALKSFGAGFFVQRQCIYAMLSLGCFEDAPADLQVYVKDLYTAMSKYIAWDDENHMYASFGHLIGYGAKYYTYMWSKVFALDFAEDIKLKEGFMSPAGGKRLRAAVLSRGGTEDPLVLAKNLLGRESDNKAFLRDIGLDNI